MLCKHNNYEDCLECIKEQHFEQYFDRQAFMYPNREDNADSGTADNYLDGVLKAIAPVKVFSRPNGMHITIKKPGEIIGRIQTWVMDSGEVWWQVDNVETGKPFGFVKHTAGVFDIPYLENSLKQVQQEKKAIVDAAVEKRLAANTNPLYKAGKDIADFIPDFDTIKWVLIVILVLIVLAVLYKIAK